MKLTYIILYYNVFYCIMLYYIMLCYVLSCYKDNFILYHIILHYIVFFFTIYNIYTQTNECMNEYKYMVCVRYNGRRCHCTNVCIYKQLYVHDMYALQSLSMIHVYKYIHTCTYIYINRIHNVYMCVYKYI